MLATLLMFPGLSGAYEMPPYPVHEHTDVRETTHFRIIYQEPLADAVPLVARYCEEAFDDLTVVFNWTPQEKTTVLVQDGFDTHNGWATSIPHNTITIYTAGPTPGTSIFQHGNYLKRTIYHELTHVLTMDMRLGYSRYMSMIFGKVVPSDPVSFGLFLFTSSPTLLSPRWCLEGLAIWSETRFCPPGRGQSTYADMIFRCAAREDRLLPYSKWYLELPHWPYGDGAYLYGMKFFQHLYETAPQTNPVGDQAQHLADAFLFGIDAATRQTTGTDARQLAEEMLAREYDIQQKNLAHLAEVPHTDLKRLTPEKISAYHPAFAGDRVYFLGRQPEKRNRMHAYDRHTGETLTISGTDSTSVFGSMTASRDGRYLYYTVLDVQQSENYRYEVRRFDTRSQEDSLVTDAGRYASISLSPDNTGMAAVSSRNGRSCLVLATLDAEGGIGDERILLRTPVLHVLSTPAFSTDSSQIVFSETNARGYALKVYDLRDDTATTIYESERQILTPVWHPRKDAVIFSSDLNGVYNLYEIEVRPARRPRPLTHVAGGLLFPAFSDQGDKIAAIGFDAGGPFVTLLTYGELDEGPEVLPVIGPSREGGKAGRLAAETDPGNGSSPTMSEAQDYNSFLAIQPDYWSPWLGAGVGSVRGGVGAVFSDPTEYQHLSLSAGVDGRNSTAIGAVHYTYKGIYPNIHLYGSADLDYYPDLLLDETTRGRFDYEEEVARVGAAVEFPFIKRKRQVSLMGGYEYKTRHAVEETEEDYLGRRLSVYPTEEDDGEVWIRASYVDGTAFASSSSVEDGRLVSLAAGVSDERLGSGYWRKRMTAEWKEYLPLPWRDNHVLLLSGFYGHGEGDDIAQGYFGLGGQSVALYPGSSPGIAERQGLRGYTTNYQTGERIVKGLASYRFPIYNFFRGHEGVFPTYLRQISGNVFYEGGRTWDEEGMGDRLEWIQSVGTEVNVALTLFRYLKFAPGLGLAYAPDKVDSGAEEDDSRLTLYISIKGWVSF